MILLVTNKRDVTTDFVVRELDARDIPFVRLNTEDIASGEVIFDLATGGWVVQVDDQTLALDAVTGAYYRRPVAPLVDTDPDDAAIAPYREGEWSAVLKSIWNELEGRWFNSPFAIMRAEDKPRQLKTAIKLGFKVPETILTNNLDRAVAFRAERSCIGKPLRHALLDDAIGPGRVIFTNTIPLLNEDDRDAISLAPVILQSEIPKTCDIRVTVVGDRVFATRIGSQETADTKTDWRKGSNPALSHSSLVLEANTAERCRVLTRELGLGFGAIDLVEDVNGQLWFLEINPNGQWAWIETRTGAPISAAIVDVLCA
ncbi:MAG: hypothetical protein ABJ242_04075 [Marinomonas sp.]